MELFMLLLGYYMLLELSYIIIYFVHKQLHKYILKSLRCYKST